MNRDLAKFEPAIALSRANEPIGTYELSIEDGVVIVYSDCHYLPDEPPSTAHLAAVELTSRFAEAGTLQAVIANGDLADFPTVSKHQRIGWEQQPSVADEIEIVRQRMSEIAAVAGLDTELVMTVGNHDARLDTFLSQNAAACEGVPGFALRDHIAPEWSMAWQVEINGSGPHSVLVRHRFKGGHTAGRANVLAAGRSVVTGHVHQPNTSRITTAAGHLWGVDCGMAAALNSRAFWAYTEGSAAAAMSNWASGFVVLTFRGGLLMPPEPVLVIDEEAGLVAFRGEIIRVGRTLH